MIRGFADRATEDIFNGVDSRRARQALPTQLWRSARAKLDILNAVSTLEALRYPPGNHLHALDRDRRGQHAIRINDQYRICFTWIDGHADRVIITDYH